MDNNNLLVYAAGLVLFWFLLHFIFKGCGSSSKSNMKSRRNAKLYYSEHCGHCKKLLPYWLECKKNAIDNNLDLDLEEIGDENLIPEDVQGYPTLDYFNGDKIERFVGGKPIMDFLSKEKLLVEKFNEGGRVDASNKYILYYATWCGYCKKLMPSWDKYTSGKSNFMKVDIDTVKDPKILENISGFPTVIVTKPNGASDKIVGYDKVLQIFE